jgi:16S rRNA (guanine527-N7)-methyltransferase
MNNILINNINKLNININKIYFNNLLKYWEILNDFNLHINLISRSIDNNLSFVLHIIDSLSALYFNLPKKINYLDLGSGGGLPGLPLAICNPDWSTTLVESKAKKASFLSNAAQALGLGNVTVLNRFLDARSSLPGPVYDLVTTRGVTDLNNSFLLINNILKPGGLFLSYKGPKGFEELNKASHTINKLNYKLIESKKIILPNTDRERILFLFQKYC